MLEEFQQHRGPIRAVCFSSDGAKLFSASGDGHVCCYDVMHAYTPVKMLSGELPDDTCVVCSAYGHGLYMHTRTLNFSSFMA